MEYLPHDQAANVLARKYKVGGARKIRNWLVNSELSTYIIKEWTVAGHTFNTKCYPTELSQEQVLELKDWRYSNYILDSEEDIINWAADRQRRRIQRAADACESLKGVEQDLRDSLKHNKPMHLRK
jgi:hypothetical protein